MNKKITVVPILFAFFCMGFADAVGPLVSLVKEDFGLRTFTATLVAFSGFISFGLFSIPLGVLQDRIGRRKILLIGLIIAFIGMVIPIFNGLYGPEISLGKENMGKFYMILLSIFLLGAGATTLQVSGNPIMRDVSGEGKFSSNLTFGQAVKAIGSSIGFVLPFIGAKLFGFDWPVLFPFFSFFLLITFLWAGGTKIQEKKVEGSSAATFGSCFKLLGSNGFVALMVFGIFMCVGAEVSMTSQIPILLGKKFSVTEDSKQVVTWLLFFLPIMIGRFTGSAILRKLSAISFLFITVIISVVGLFLLLIGNKEIAYVGIVLTGLGFANIFPVIFSITVEKLPERTNELSGLMVFAIVGGAFIPLLTGAISDLASVTLCYIVPLACIIYVGMLGLINLKKK